MEKEYISVDRLRQFAEKINTAISGLDLSEYLKTTDAEEMFATIIAVDNLTDATAVLAGAVAALAARVTGSEEALGEKQDKLKEGENITITEDNTISASVDLSGKQDKLTAGENITISGTTISATDTTYSAGTNVQISSSNVISAYQDLSDYALKSEIPTQVSELENDSGFITDSALDNYYTKSDTYSKDEVEQRIAQIEAGEETDLNNYLTKTEASETYQPIGDYVTKEEYDTTTNNLQSQIDELKERNELLLEYIVQILDNIGPYKY